MPNTAVRVPQPLTSFIQRILKFLTVQVLIMISIYFVELLANRIKQLSVALPIEVIIIFKQLKHLKQSCFSLVKL